MDAIIELMRLNVPELLKEINPRIIRFGVRG
jgi:hypothetical protein